MTEQPILYDTELPAVDVAELAAQEAIIERGLATFVEVGTALLAIRDGRLYRADYGTFEDYCRERWGMSRSYAHRTIEAAQVVANLLPIGNIPTNESQARPLAALPPETQREVYREAVDTAPNGKVTAAHITSIIETRIGTPHVAHNSGNNEWYTPREYIEAARAVMGGIDLDPASSAEANQVVGAARYYTADDDGLSHEWAGRVWMNPPYAANLIGEFTSRLADSYHAGQVIEAICLVNNATETEWFGALVDHASAIVFPARRIRFWLPGGEIGGGPLQGQAAIYLGPCPVVFIEHFGRFGWAAMIP